MKKEKTSLKFIVREERMKKNKGTKFEALANFPLSFYNNSPNGYDPKGLPLYLTCI
jgi:hypothetical protein